MVTGAVWWSWPGIAVAWPRPPWPPEPPPPGWGPPALPPPVWWSAPWLLPWLRPGTTVTISTNEPGGPAAGTLWLNPTSNVLSVYDGTQWRGYLPLSGGRIDGDLAVTGKVDFGP